jgi:tripeptidyl-peptidase-1
MLASLLNRGALSLAVVSLLTSTAAAEVFDKLAAVPEGNLLVLLA